MKLLHFIFRLFSPDFPRKRTLLSQAFHRFQQDQKRNENRILVERGYTRDSNFYYVAGAGWLVLGKNANSKTGTAHGFSLSCEWGLYYGGVIDRADALRLANDILSTCQS